MLPVSPLTIRTRELLKHRDRTKTMEVIACETKLNKRWLEAFMRRVNQEHGANRVTVLYEYLSGKKLEVL